MLKGIVLRKLRSNQRLEAMTRRMAHRMGLVRGSLHERRAPPYRPVVLRSPGAVARGAQQSTLSLKCLSDFQACGAGASSPAATYPSRLEADLKTRLPGR